MDWSLELVLSNYAQGFFLMADEQGALGWYTSRERAILPLDENFRYPKSLRRVLNQNRFSIAIDRDFTRVCQGCADRDSTWISAELINIYTALHQAGYAHSFEAWSGDRLAGGVLGIALGGAFIGESMFFNIADGSKVALVKLVEHLRDRKFELFDVQLQNPHLERFGTHTISEAAYQQRLQSALELPCQFIE
ncbi:MAG: leucyl/phenylalanyl-tRNA--protein transferase [Cyanobacteria bacterium P01_H01_bin.15]